MPLRKITNTDASYYLINFDKDGSERPESDGTLISDTIRDMVSGTTNGITDVFLSSHGWKGDVPAAIEQYDRWVGEMSRATGDRAVATQVRPGFKSLVIGIHWPSLPWGDEDSPAETSGVLSAGDANSDIETRVATYAASIADTPAARDAIRTILTAASSATTELPTLPPKIRAAYDTLYAEAGLISNDISAAPGCDRESWDPEVIYQEALHPEATPAGATAGATAGTTTLARPSAGAPGLLGFDLGSIKEALLMPLRQGSFWRMKERAQKVGETGVHRLLLQLQSVAAPNVRFHLMGHSFGCIVVSAGIAGAPKSKQLPRPVDSLVLIQGALSLWSYCNDIPYAPGKGGYFQRILAEQLVRGPIVTTRSRFDTAVGSLYPKAAGLKRQLVLGDDPFPKYGGVGAFGLQGLGARATDLPMQSSTANYGFAPGHIYNLDANGVIKNGGGFSGAHSDIAHPEVAHAVWQAALVS